MNALGTRREQLLGAGFCCCGTPRNSSPFPRARHSRQGCPAGEKLHLKHTEHQQTQSTEDVGYGLEPFLLHGIGSGGIQGIIPVLQQVEVF